MDPAPRARPPRRWHLETFLAVATTGALAVGSAAWLLGRPAWADQVWTVATLLAVGPALAWVVDALRHGRAGVDLVAVLALLGTLAVGEPLAGALVAVMVATGRALDAAAHRRATRDLRALLERAPRTARLRRGDELHTVPVDEVRAGDHLVVGVGEVVPVDGRVAAGVAVLDESSLTGEARAVDHPTGANVRSGTLNAGAPFDLDALATAADSTYAGIVRLAQQASAETAPVVRLADRYAAWFLPLALGIAGVAWLVTGSSVRAVAVLVVATPCPLLLAAPVAIVSGMARATRLGVIVRDGGSLETLAGARTLVLDKTGTLTMGRPRVVEVVAAPGTDPARLLRLAASVEQASPHVLAEAIVREARRREHGLVLPTEVREQAGRGIEGRVDGCTVAVGRSPGSDAEWVREVSGRAHLDGAAVAWVRVDEALAGALVLDDPVRRDAPRTLRRLRAAGLTRLVLLTGDRPAAAREVGSLLGLDEVRADQSPTDKVAAVREERSHALTAMVGDGINDAPALAAADVGIAMGARGATASSEAADVVLTTDRLDPLADAMEVAARSRRIAVQSAAGGMGLSLVAMVIAAFGLLPPALGALTQELIDIGVILNALRARRHRPHPTAALAADTTELLRRFEAEHDELRDTLALVREAADQLLAAPWPRALASVRRAHALVVEQILPHEQAEEDLLYPALAAPLGSVEATATMSRAHAEITRLATRVGTHLAAMGHDDPTPPDPARVEDLLTTLYGLHAVLRLHFAQEEEAYFSLAGAAPTAPAA